MIEAFIFDFGNVICKFDHNIFLEKLTRHCDKTVGQLRKLIFCDTDIRVRFESGKVTGDEFYREVVKTCGLSISKSEFIDAHTDIFTPIPETFELIKKLKPKYKLGLLSNTNVWDFESQIRNMEVIGLFDVLTLSHEAGAVKPDRKIYDDVLKKLKLPAEKCVYIDDIQEYTDIGNSLGFNAINYQGPDKLLNELQKMEIQF
ncbi:MAG: HAD family phosphatase [Planctomycetaceae bacterium]|nr:HAD family phosphatase [Planctomycetaceae bacterium]